MQCLAHGKCRTFDLSAGEALLGSTDRVVSRLQQWCCESSLIVGGERACSIGIEVFNFDVRTRYGCAIGVYDGALNCAGSGLTLRKYRGNDQQREYKSCKKLDPGKLSEYGGRPHSCLLYRVLSSLRFDVGMFKVHGILVS